MLLFFWQKPINSRLYGGGMVNDYVSMSAPLAFTQVEFDIGHVVLNLDMFTTGF